MEDVSETKAVIFVNINNFSCYFCYLFSSLTRQLTEIQAEHYYLLFLLFADTNRLSTLYRFLMVNSVIVIYIISGIKAILQDSSAKIADDEGVSSNSSVTHEFPVICFSPRVQHFIYGCKLLIKKINFWQKRQI
jgi:hypothetical protein